MDARSISFMDWSEPHVRRYVVPLLLYMSQTFNRIVIMYRKYTHRECFVCVVKIVVECSVVWSVLTKGRN